MKSWGNVGFHSLEINANKYFNDLDVYIHTKEFTNIMN